MPITHILLALIVVSVWGINFIFVKLCLLETTPLLLCAIRFFLASVPAIFFIKRPNAPFKYVAAYGLVMFALQFSFVFLGMSAGMTAGIASLIMQVQVFFSMLFGAVFLGDKPGWSQILGAIIAFTGIAVVAGHFDNDVSLAGFLFFMAGAATWGIGNLINKKIQNVQLLPVVVWSSFTACLPMFVIAMIFEGTDSIAYTYNHYSMTGIMSILYIVYASTWVGYGIWSWLISRHSIGTVVPFSLLIPVVGMLSSSLIFNEPFESWKFLAAILVISGLGVSLFGKRMLRRWLITPQQPAAAG